MRYLKNLIKILGYMVIIIILSTLTITIFSYFNLFNDSIIKVLKYIIPVSSVFIAGIMIGRRATKKGIIEGARLALIIDSLFILLSLVFKNFNATSLIYYLIIAIVTIFGSLIGVQKKVQN